MSLRLRLVLSIAALAAAATATACTMAYLSTRDRLYEELDHSLTEVQVLVRTASERRGRGGPDGGPFAPGSLLFREVEARTRQLGVTTQILDPSGEVVRSLNADGGRTLPVDAVDRLVAAGGGTARRNVVTDEGDVRLLTVPITGGGAAQIARDLTETQSVLESLRRRYVALAVIVSALAAALGLWVARHITRPLVQLTDAVELVGTTGRLDHAVLGTRNDETGRLANAFNAMLGALGQSRRQQQQLVQDAGHELRTPLTSLRTNVSVLRKYDQLSPEQMSRTVDDLSSELVELTTLVNEIVELATDARHDEPLRNIELRTLVERSAQRVERRTGRRIAVVADGSVVAGREAALERAVTNLVDNAVKFDDSAGPIEITVHNGNVAVHDRGPGIAPADLPHIFDRFYRSEAARAKPGSGLGLAIVAAIVADHGGTVRAEARAGGGTVFTLQLPLT